MKRKVLFIEDEPTLHTTFGDALKEENIELISALDGETGLRLAKETNPDLVLLDLVLPTIDGIVVLKQLREEENTKDTPIIVLTNSEDMLNVQRAIDLGATTYLVKINYNLGEVVQKVKNILEGR